MNHQPSSTADAGDLGAALKASFGFSSFRPLQEEIIRDALAGRDVFALLPTGGGKSLCFQLPAVVREGLTLVVSPLIALMKDQVDALGVAGIPATFLNSSLDAATVAERRRGLGEGRYRLLYVAPERLTMGGALAELAAWNVSAVAVDEAHCISAWGHDFRPEYRRLEGLRAAFPKAPIMAVTATATARVQEDIVASLGLRDPRCYVASFDRPNLVYRVDDKVDAYEQLLALVRRREGECGIVYGLSRSTAEDLAGRLAADGVQAAAYHAGLPAAERARTQEAFARDEVRVVCATVAFGMGINKPNVRFVVHVDLPRNVESYYQETGRAGRDGLPSECLLLFRPGDAAKQLHFIREKPDAAEREQARRQLDDVVRFAESAECRRTRLLGYFGEHREAGPCGGCDNCLSPREPYDGTVAAQKFLSCVLRMRQKSGRCGGVAEVAEVLRGSKRDRVLEQGFEQLSTYGIGSEHSRHEWQGIGRELLGLGLLRQGDDGAGALEVTAAGRATLKERSPVMLSRRVAGSVVAAPLPAGPPCDEALLATLQALARRLAAERDVPAYVIFSEVALRQMARDYPTEPGAFIRVAGVGDRKLADFGGAFMEAIAGHVATHGKLVVEGASPPTAPARPKPITDTIRETLRRFAEGASPAAIAEGRGLAETTIFGHLAVAIEAGEPVGIDGLLTADQQARIGAAFAAIGTQNLTGVLERLGEGFSYGQLRIFRATLGRRG